LEKNPENVELIEQVKQEMEAMHAAMEAGDEDAAREHAPAMREVMQQLRPDMPERRMSGRRGERRQ
jgi:prephenate dehydrogenase